MSQALVDDLRRQIAEGQCIVVVGTGVSVAGTRRQPCASWAGLLRHGVQRCVEVVPKLPADWSKRVNAEIDSGDLDDLLSAAEKVARKLGAPDGGEYSLWLRESISALRADDPEVLLALRDLAGPSDAARPSLILATTNYDNLIEEVTGLPAVTWREGARVERVLRGDDRGVVHLHGHWQWPGSVVLGIRSYEEILGSEHAQAMLRAMAALRTIVFVGCADGLDDPNFGALLEWTGKAFAGSEYRRFCLTRNGEVARLQAAHPPDQRLFVLGYGDSFSDLAPFLRSLRPAVQDTAPPAVLQPVASASALPPRPRCFGREHELDDLVTALLAAAPEPVPVLGPPGIGKTNLALAAAHDPGVAARFGARRFFVRCDGLRSRADVAAAIAAALGLVLGKDNEKAALVELGREPALLIVDNVETPWDADVLGVEELLARLAGLAGVALVVTVRGTQRPAGVPWRDPFLPKPLSHAAARDLFLSVAGKQFSADPHLDRLLSAVDEVPLAITLTAVQAEGEPDLAAIWDRWERERTAMLERAGGKDRLTNMELSYELSWSGPRMTAGGRRLLQLLALLPAGLTHEDVSTLLPDEGAPAAAVLRKAGLAFDEAGRLRVLAPLREYVRRRHPVERVDLEALVRHFASLVARLGRQVGNAGGAEAVVRLGAEAPNVERMLVAGFDAKLGTPVLDAAQCWGEFVRFTGQGSSLPIERAAKFAQSLGASIEQANLTECLGKIALERRDYESARVHFGNALALYREIGSVLGQAISIYGWGSLAFTRYDHKEATKRFREALPLYRQAKDAVGEAMCISSLADVARRCSEHDQARDGYEKALALYRQANDIQGQANCIFGLGDVAIARFDFVGARKRYEEAQPLYEKAGDFLGAANCILRIGEIMLRMRDHPGALSRFQQAMQLYEQRGDLLGQGNCQFGSALSLLALGREAEAVAPLRGALVRYQGDGNPYSIGAAHFLLGKTCTGSERDAHRRAAREAWSVLEPEALVGMAAADGIDPRELDDEPQAKS